MDHVRTLIPVGAVTVVALEHRLPAASGASPVRSRSGSSPKSLPAVAGYDVGLLYAAALGEPRAGAGPRGPKELVRAVHDEIAAWAGGLGHEAVALALRRH